MLGLIGFSVATITFLFYGLVARKFDSKKTKFNIHAYATAYYLASCACLAWALATQVDNNMIEKFVVIGDIFILGASIFLLRTITPPKKTNLYTALGTVVLALCIVSRFVFKDLPPIMQEEVLIFNTPRVLGAILVIVMLTVWLKSNMLFYEKFIAPRIGSDLLRSSYFSSNILSFIGVCGFMFARKSLTIIVAFSMIIFGFFMLAILNYAILKRSNSETLNGK